MKTPAPPPAPDPGLTAAKQTEANTAAAKTTQQMNMVDQTNPYGSSTYTQTGTWSDGTPKFSNTVTLSPQEQAKQDQQWQFDSLVNNLGINQTQKLTGLLDKPVNLNNEATESRLMELGSRRLAPQLERGRSQLESKLASQGVYQGSEAYDNAMRQYGQQENDAYTQLLLQGRGQAVQEALTERNQPINEITALMSGGQVQQPNFIGTPTAQVAAPDVAGLTMDAYKYGPLAQYQAKNSMNQAMMTGLFGLGSAVGGGWARNGFSFGK